MRKYLVVAVAAALLLVACKSTNGSPTAVGTAPPTGASADTRAPGVTASTIKIGVTYVDLSSLESILHLNMGDWPKAYQAMVDNINAHGGIHGRKLVADIVPVVPTTQTSADAACTKLTQDDKVFVAVGFFLNDNVLCYVNTNRTATIGGSMTSARLAQAKVPWFSTDTGESTEVGAVKAMAEAGKLNGKLAVMATAADQVLLDDKIKPALQTAGIKPVVSAVLDAPTNDVTANYAQAQTIAERFKAAGANQVLIVGESGAGGFLPGLTKTNYRPQLIFSNMEGTQAYSTVKSNDLSVLRGSLAAGLFGPNDDRLALGGPTQACMDIQRRAGLVIKPSSTVPPGQPDQFDASSAACGQMALLTAILQNAGPTLDYGTFRAAGDSLGPITLPTFPDPWHFGPPPAADGDPKLYLFKWDATSGQFVRLPS